MNDLGLTLELFHFLRPWLLLSLPLIGLLWWWLRFRRDRSNTITDTIAPHLRQALSVGAGGRGRVRPIDNAALLLALAFLGAAGPTWSRVPDPFVAQTAPLVIALRVDPSMQANDVMPSRLERAKQKIRDLLQLRAGARTALIAYAGTAHAVVPMTEDPNVLQPYLEGLEPDVMPDKGNNAGLALEMAKAVMAREAAAGGILFITDAIDSTDIAALNAEDQASLGLLAMLPQGTGDAGIDKLSMTVTPLTTGDADVSALDRQLNAAYRRAMAKDGDQPWDDRGWLLAWPAAMLGLFWFRRGWTMRWSMVLALGFMSLPTHQARAEGIADWFMTPDQQGQIAYQRKDFERAASLFADPLHKAYAQYHDGQYEAATQTLQRVDSAEASFLQGISYIRNRQYREGIAAYQTTLQRDPDFPGAAENLEIAKQILDYVETAREQSDTGEANGMGADEVVYDNKDARGTDTDAPAQDPGATLLTTDQWMNTVDTDTGDFLRQRFAIEARQ